MLYPNKLPPKKSVAKKPILSPTDVAIQPEIYGVGFLSIGEILKFYKFPFERK